MKVLATTSSECADGIGGLTFAASGPPEEVFAGTADDACHSRSVLGPTRRQVLYDPACMFRIIPLEVPHAVGVLRFHCELPTTA